MTRRVLFVDNDRHLFDDLESGLRSAPGDWAVVHAMSAADARLQLARAPYDVVVAKTGPAGIDGSALLDEVAAIQPRAVRFLMAEGHGRSTLVDAGGTAHQHLAKPLRSPDVFARFARTLALGDLLSDPDLLSLVSRLKSIPSLPPTYFGIMTELRKEEASARKVGTLVAQDGGMSAKVLQLVNSPFFGLRMPVSDPIQAIQLLGLETVRALVLSMHVFAQLDLKTITRFGLGRTWRHSLSSAGFARVIARIQGSTADMAAEAFSAALLHDIGKLVLACSMPDDYAVVIEQATSDGLATWRAERELLQTTHAEVGAYLLGLWGLPPSIVEAVAWHHGPSHSPVPGWSSLAAVHVADVIDHRLHPADAWGVPPDADQAYLDRLALTSELPAWTAACLAADTEAHGRPGHRT